MLSTAGEVVEEGCLRLVKALTHTNAGFTHLDLSFNRLGDKVVTQHLLALSAHK